MTTNSQDEKIDSKRSRARILIEAIPVSLVAISREGKITDVNEIAAQITGISRHELLGTDFSNYFTEPEKAREEFQKVFSEGSVKDFPLAIRHISGKITCVLYNATVYKDDTGNIQGAFATVHDITKRKIAGNVPCENSPYVRSLIEANLDPLVTISKEGKITDANEATARVTGISRDKLIGSDFSDYFTEPDMAKKCYEHVLSNGFVRDYPLATRHTSGRITHVTYNASLYKNKTGEIEGVFAVAHDMTERKKAESDLYKKNEDLINSNKEFEQFAYVVSHDLQEPLRTIYSFAEFLETDYKGKLDKKADEYIEFITSSARRMQQMINDILDLSRVGTRRKEFTPTNIEKIINIVIENLRGSINKHKATITYDIPLPTIIADEMQIIQLLQNLIDNGIKFHREHELPMVHISFKEEDNEWIFCIKDNGIGIEEKYFKKLFVIFSRLHGKDEYSSTGIGLAICKKIVERHGGRIWLESKFGQGSTFYFAIPKKSGRNDNQ
jgi:PAS domain S-box-containing protein